jgi:RNA polymerase sigma-70 factor (ECF subfamily)
MRRKTANAIQSVQMDIAAEREQNKARDEQLVTAAMRGSGAAFAMLFERYERRMFRLVLKLLRNREDAEDAVQQAFQRAFVHLKSFQGQARFSTWLTRIAINEALMMLRKRRPNQLSLTGNAIIEEENATLDIEDEAETPEQRYQQQELRGILTDAIGELRPKLRKVVHMHELGELTTENTAAALGLATGTVKARTFRARRVLRGKLIKRMGWRKGEVAGTLFLPSRTAHGTMRRAQAFAGAT